MRTRRALLGAVAGSSVALAGCFCDDSRAKFDLGVDVQSVARRDDRWVLDVSVFASFTGEKDDRTGIYGLDVGCYDPGPTALLASESVGDLRWADVPEGNRSSSRFCAPTGSVETTVQLTAPSLPYFVGPRILDRSTFVSYHCGHEGLRTVEASVYEGSTAPEDWPPTTVDADDYTREPVADVPWPVPDLSAVGRADGLDDVTFRMRPHCYDRRRTGPDLRVFDGDLSLTWGRYLPDAPDSRPSLQTLARSGSELVVTVGTSRVPYLPRRSWDLHQYELAASVSEETAEAIDRATLAHVRPDGSIDERVMVYR